MRDYTLSPPQRLLLYCVEIGEREILKRAGADGRVPSFSLREPRWRRERFNWLSCTNGFAHLKFSKFSVNCLWQRKD